MSIEGVRAGFHVVGVETQSPKPDQVVKCLPDDAGHRRLGHHPEQHEAAGRGRSWPTVPIRQAQVAEQPLRHLRRLVQR